MRCFLGLLPPRQHFDDGSVAEIRNSPLTRLVNTCAAFTRPTVRVPLRLIDDAESMRDGFQGDEKELFVCRPLAGQPASAASLEKLKSGGGMRVERTRKAAHQRPPKRPKPQLLPAAMLCFPGIISLKLSCMRTLSCQ